MALKKKALFAELLVLTLILFVGWKLRSRNLYYVMDVCEVLLLTVLLYMMPLLELTVNNLAIMASFMLVNKTVLQYVYIPAHDHSRIIPFVFFLLLELFVLIRVIHQRKRGYGIVIGYAVICCSIVLYVFHKCREALLPYFFEGISESGSALKVLFLLTGIAVLMVPVLILIRLFNIFVGKRLKTLQDYSITYTEIDRSIVLVLILTLCCLMMTELVSLVGEDSTYEFPLLWIGLCAIIVMIQAIYIRLLVKSIFVKEKMRLQENNLQNLTRYNHELEHSMESMSGIRHDIKNLFLTMGGFVDRSADEEMKTFYAENIVPFAKQELLKNDLYAKLADIHDEGMKSFLYFKMMQGVEQNIPMDLSVQFDSAEESFCIGQTDLIRILGILLDNAIEEASSCNGTVMISLKETEEEYLFSVSNTVRKQKRKKGIAAGTTDKGLGRGNGLLIAEKLIQKYRNVILNSYFMEEKFVQCLRIEK